MATTETEASFKAPPGNVWQREPFRLFFPLGVLLGAAGAGHWLLYAVGLTSTYSCMAHGSIQMQAFLMAFAAGFLLTALPRRTQSPPPSAAELTLFATALVTATAGAWMENWILAQSAYALQFVLLLQFAVRRFRQRAAGRRPPAAFVLIPIAILNGLAGAGLIAASVRADASLWMEGLGRLLVEQGVFLCLVAGVGSLILPLMSGESPPRDLGSSPAETRKAFAYALAGILISASLVLEQFGWPRSAPLLRAAVVAAAVAFGGGALRPPGKPGLHRRLVWLSVWLLPTGLVLSTISPDFRVPMLHVSFIGGFGLMAFGVATHVTLGHLDLQQLALGRPRAIVAVAAFLFLALITRLAADISDTYFLHLGVAAVFWLAASAVWLKFIGPLLWQSRDGRGDEQASLPVPPAQS
jgi:uncharacterized protein involved in response to NO